MITKTLFKRFQLTTQKVPNVVDNFDVCDHILSIYIKNETVIVCECKCVVDFLCGIRNYRSIVELIVGLNPSAKCDFIQVIFGTGEFHVIVDARFLKVEYKVRRRKKLAAIAVEEWLTFASEFLVDCFVVDHRGVLGIAQSMRDAVDAVFAGRFYTRIVSNIAQVAFQADWTFATEISLINHKFQLHNSRNSLKTQLCGFLKIHVDTNCMLRTWFIVASC